MATEDELLLSDLRAAGYDVGHVSVLRTSGERYAEAVPVLVDWLPRITDRGLLDSVVRALSVPWAKPAAVDALVRLFETLPPEEGEMGLRWTVGNALEVVGDDGHFDDLARLARDRRFGRAREMVVLWFGKVGKKRRDDAVTLLLELVEDPDVDGHATQALARLADPRSREALERMAGDDRAWVRAKATAGLKKLGLISWGQGHTRGGSAAAATSPYVRSSPAPA